MDEIKNGEKIFIVTIIILLFIASFYAFNTFISPKLDVEQIKSTYTEIECADMVHSYMVDSDSFVCSEAEEDSSLCISVNENFVDRKMYEGCMANDFEILEMIQGVQIEGKEQITSVQDNSTQKVTNMKSESQKSITSDVKPQTEIKKDLVPTDLFCSISTGKGVYKIDESITVSWISSNADRISWGGNAGSSMVVYPPIEPTSQGSVSFKLNDNGGRYTSGKKSISLEVMNEKGHTFCEVVFTVID